MGRIAIVGAGMAAAAAVDVLHGAGVPLTVFEKSRGLGGRLATRRADSFVFNHGAPVAGGRTAEFRHWMQARSGAAETKRGFVHGEGMNRLLSHVFEAVQVEFKTEISAIEKSSNELWLRDARESLHGPFSGVILTCPFPQAVAIVGGLVDLRDGAHVEMLPQWTLLVGGHDSGVLENVDVVQSVEPALSVQNGGEGFVVHFDHAFSEDYLELERPLMAERLWREIASDLPLPPYLAAHRWRYSRVGQALGRPFAGDVRIGVLLGGDWALGPETEHAWQSGRAMAQAMISR